MGLQRKAREHIIDVLRSVDEMPVEQVIEIVRPHFIFDAVKAREQSLRRTSLNIVRSLKDDNGTRQWYVNKDENGVSEVVNVEKTSDEQALINIMDSLKKKLDGLEASYKKVRKRRREIQGQTSFFVAK